MPSSISSFDKKRVASDQYLVIFTKGRADGRFGISLAVAFGTMILCWNALLATGAVPFSAPALSQAEDNRTRVVEFMRSPESEIAITGTSLTYRLPTSAFNSSTKNVALAGGSSSSSATIGATVGPSILVIELNILDREPDTDLEELSGLIRDPPFGIPALATALSPTRAAIAAVYHLDEVFDERLQAERKSLPLLLDALPAEITQGADLDHAVEAWENRPSRSKVEEVSARAIVSAAEQVETNGGNAFYVLLPLDPRLAATEYASRGVEAVKAIDPEFQERFLSVQWAYDQIRWDSDGAHLDPRSAIVVARQISDAIDQRMGVNISGTVGHEKNQ